MNKSRKIKFKNKEGSKEELKKLIIDCSGRKEGVCKYYYCPCKSVIKETKCPVIKLYSKTHTLGDIK